MGKRPRKHQARLNLVEARPQVLRSTAMLVIVFADALVRFLCNWISEDDYPFRLHRCRNLLHRDAIVIRLCVIKAWDKSQPEGSDVVAVWVDVMKATIHHVNPEVRQHHFALRV